jgi:hypothetical protein
LGNAPRRVVSNAGEHVSEPYDYDPHGNMLRMPQLPQMQWDYKDQLTCRQKVNDQDTEGAEHHSERTWYVYDTAHRADASRTARSGLSRIATLKPRRFPPPKPTDQQPKNDLGWRSEYGNSMLSSRRRRVFFIGVFAQTRAGAGKDAEIAENPPRSISSDGPQAVCCPVKKMYNK